MTELGSSFKQPPDLKCLVLQIVEELVEGGDVRKHLDAEVLQPVDGHQIDDDGKTRRMRPIQFGKTWFLNQRPMVDKT